MMELIQIEMDQCLKSQFHKWKVPQEITIQQQVLTRKNRLMKIIKFTKFNLQILILTVIAWDKVVNKNSFLKQ